MNWKPLLWIGLGAIVLLALMIQVALELLKGEGIYVTGFTLTIEPFAYVAIPLIILIGLATYFICQKLRSSG